MTKSQKAMEVTKFLQLSPSERKATLKHLAAQHGVGYSTLERGVRILKIGHPEIIAAVEEGVITTNVATTQILHFPLAEQPAVLKQILLGDQPKKSKSKSKPRINSGAKRGRRQWTDAEIEKEKACLTEIDLPSLYPITAVLPRSNDTDTVEVLTAIEWLRSEEGKISDYRIKDLDAMLLRTNRIQAYKVNYGNSAKPDGELDSRIYDWASQLWRKQQRQHDRINLRRAVLKRHKASTQPLVFKTVRTFEKRFETFWMTVEDSLSLFKPHEHPKLIKALKAAITDFFSEKSPDSEKVDEAAMALAQEV